MQGRQGGGAVRDMLGGTMRGRQEQEVLLLLDTCGERASVALAAPDGGLVAQVLLEPRSASANLVDAIRSVLGQNGLRLGELAGVGVVNGPGSFTGVRLGLALGKGLCEAGQLAMAVVSRLDVMAEAGPADAMCALSAGRDAMFVRVVQGGVPQERMLCDRDVEERRHGKLVVVDSPQMMARLAEGGPVQQVDLLAIDALGAVLRRFAEGGSDIALADANYVRDEAAIYRKKANLPGNEKGDGPAPYL